MRRQKTPLQRAKRALAPTKRNEVKRDKREESRMKTQRSGLHPKRVAFVDTLEPPKGGFFCI